MGDTVSVGTRELQVSNLDKVLYPESGFTKAQVIDYYFRIAPVMVPHLEGRCVTLRRFPDGVEKAGFYEKRCATHRPPWVKTAVGPGDRRGTIDYCVFDEPAALVWSANMAAIELHAPMAKADDLESPRAVVFDFDPGEPAALRECCAVALLVRDILGAVDLQGWCKTSGSKGLQLYVPLNTPTTHDQAATFALAVGQVLERDRPHEVTTTMAKVVRPGKVFVDWSQNARHKTTIAPYSLRARPRPTASTPITWEEVAACAAGGEPPAFEADALLRRVDDVGDLFAPVLSLRQVLPGPTGRA